MYATLPRTVLVESTHQKLLGAVSWHLPLAIQCVETCTHSLAHQVQLLSFYNSDAYKRWQSHLFLFYK